MRRVCKHTSSIEALKDYPKDLVFFECCNRCEEVLKAKLKHLNEERQRLIDMSEG